MTETLYEEAKNQILVGLGAGPNWRERKTVDGWHFLPSDERFVMTFYLTEVPSVDIYLAWERLPSNNPQKRPGIPISIRELYRICIIPIAERYKVFVGYPDQNSENNGEYFKNLTGACEYVVVKLKENIDAQISAS